MCFLCTRYSGTECDGIASTNSAFSEFGCCIVEGAVQLGSVPTRFGV